MERLRIAHVYRKAAREFVARHHSHHRAHVGEIYALGAYVGPELVAVVVAARPVAIPADDGATWEITRLCCGPNAPKYTASRLIGRIGRIAHLSGVTRLISYTRVDEPGTCYLASNWTPMALSPGRPHTTGNRSQRWIPGLYEPSSEIIDRVRWERVSDTSDAEPLEWDGNLWRLRADKKETT